MNPITELQGGGPFSPETPLPEPQSLPPAGLQDALQAPPEVLAPDVPAIPEGGGLAVPPPAPPSVFPTGPDPSPSPYATPGSVAPRITGNQEALNILAPTVNAAIQGGRKETSERLGYALSPEAVPITTQWNAPDLEGSISNFGYNSQALISSFQRQAAQREASEREWLDRNMKAIEALNKPQGSATENSMDWVSQMLGTSEEGGRSYVRPVVMNKQTGEWQGSPVGTVLYGLGILQNSAMGAVYDITNIFRNVDRGVRQAYDTFTPPWARGGTDAALSTLQVLLPQLRVPSMVSTGKYNDGKSNFVEALRGAQYSFSDKQGLGFGIGNDKGFRLSTNLGDYTGNTGGGFSGPKFLVAKDKPGFDINPSVIVGLAGDIIAGGRLDKLLSKLLPAAAKPAITSATRPAPRGSTPLPEPKQLEIPFLSGPVTSKKPPTLDFPYAFGPRLPAPRPPRKPPKGDIQTVLPISSMMDDFDAADRLLRPNAYKPGLNNEGGQLSLRLGKIDRVPLTPLLPATPPAVAKRAGKQLKIEFDILPEAVPPRVAPRPLVIDTAAESLADLTPAPRGEVLNVMESRIGDALNALKEKMRGKPDIGRRFTPLDLADGPIYTPSFGPATFKASAIDVASTPVFHGTQVKNLDLTRIDPTRGAAMSELGTGIYTTPDRNVAELAAKSARSEGLPGGVAREFHPTGQADLHTVTFRSDALVINGADPLPELGTIAERVSDNFPGLKGGNFQDKSVAQILDVAASLDDSVKARLEFQQQFARALASEGIDGVKMGDNIAVYNPAAFQSSTKAPTQGFQDVSTSLNSRSQLEDWGESQVKTGLAEAQALDAKAQALSASLADVQQAKAQALRQVYEEIQLKGLMDHPSRVPTLDEYTRLVVQDMYTGSAPQTNRLLSQSIPESEVTEALDALSDLARSRGVKITEGNLAPNVLGTYTKAPTNFSIPTVTLANNLERGDVSSLRTLIHELSHHEINKLVPYVKNSTGPTFNEAIVDGVSNTVISILFPTEAAKSKATFDSFFSYLVSEGGQYRQKAGAIPVPSAEVLKQGGELAVTLVKDIVEKIRPGFKSPSLDALRIFGPDQFSNFAKSRFASYDTLAEAARNSLTTLDTSLSPLTQIKKLATNPVTGAINTDVMDLLRLRFVDELSDIDALAKPKLVEEWAARTKGGENITSRIQRGGIDYDSYVRELEKLDPKGPAKETRAQIDDYLERLYC